MFTTAIYLLAGFVITSSVTKKGDYKGKLEGWYKEFITTNSGATMSRETFDKVMWALVYTIGIVGWPVYAVRGIYVKYFK
jgi:hypothetical protein